MATVKSINRYCAHAKNLMKRPHVEDSTDSGEVLVKKLKADRSDPTITNGSHVSEFWIAKPTINHLQVRKESKDCGT